MSAPPRRLIGNSLLARRGWVVVHRWSGLVIALFLVIAGVTGSVLPFEEELTFASAPRQAHVQPPTAGARVLSGVEIARRVERSTGASVEYIPLDISADHVVRMFVSARPGRPVLPYDVVWADPYTGVVRLSYRWGGLGDGPVNIVPFLFSLHYGIVAGAWGSWTFGVAALIWTLDCFVGFALTLPRIVRSAGRSNGRRRSWWMIWGAAWKIRRYARGHRLNFDLHRAGGLWLWPLLLAFAWSSVGLLLPSVERPIMHALGASADYIPASLATPVVRPPVGRENAVRAATAALVEIGRPDGFSVVAVEGLSYDPNSATYRIDARTTLDRGARAGATSIWIDARHGRMLRLSRPFGTSTADTVRHLAVLLHFAEILGLPYRVFVSLLGLGVAGLSITGVLIWLKKRSALQKSQMRRRNPTIAPALC